MGKGADLRKDLHEARREIARLEEALRKAQAGLDNVDGNNHAAISALRHELRTPLNTVLGFAQILRSSPLGNCEPVEQIFNAATRLAELTADESEAGAPSSESVADSSARRDSIDHFRVLYIEDNQLNCKLVGHILAQRDGIEVMFASRGNEGLAVAREWLPSLILLDLNLPDMHGGELLRVLRSDKRTEYIPVVVVSADATATQIEHLLADGARNYLTKPIDVEQFLATVDEVLDETRAGSRLPQATPL